MPPTLIVFDLGGVVLRICRTWEQACAAAGLPYRPAIASPDLVAARRAAHHDYECGRIECDAFFEAIAATTQGLYTAEQFRRIHDAWLLHEYPGVGELIQDLHRAGITTAVLSNTNASHWRRFVPSNGTPAEFPSPSLVDHLHASHLLGLAKPDVQIHREFERRVHAAGWRGDPDQILFFEDTPANIDGARTAGWHAELIDHTGDTAAQTRAYLTSKGVL